MVRGTVPMKDGMLLVACAIERPSASVMTQAKSFDSRTIVENEVRTSETAASSTIEIRRRQSNSNVIPFSIVPQQVSPSFDVNIRGGDDLRPFFPLGPEELARLLRRSANDRKRQRIPHVLQIAGAQDLVDVAVERADDCIRNASAGRHREPAGRIEAGNGQLADGRNLRQDFAA